MLMMIPARLMLTVQLATSAAYRLAPVPIHQLVKNAEAICYVGRSKDPFRPVVREVIWSSIGCPTGPLELDSTPLFHPKGTPDEGGPDAVYSDSIVFLHRVKKGSAMAGANIAIVLDANRSECSVQRVPSYNSPVALIVHGTQCPVYFPLPFKHAHRAYVTYAELKAAILKIARPWSEAAEIPLRPIRSERGLARRSFDRAGGR